MILHRLQLMHSYLHAMVVQLAGHDPIMILNVYFIMPFIHGQLILMRIEYNIYQE